MNKQEAEMWTHVLKTLTCTESEWLEEACGMDSPLTFSELQKLRDEFFENVYKTARFRNLIID